MKDPNAFQGRGQQPPVDGTGIVLATIWGLCIWCGLTLIGIGLDRYLATQQ